MMLSSQLLTKMQKIEVNKMKKINLLVILSSVMLLSSCKNTPPSDSVTDSLSSSDSALSESNDSTSSTENSSNAGSDSSSEIIEDEYNVLPDWDIISLGFSAGSDLLDIAVDRAFMTGADYSLTYSMDSSIPSDPKNETAISSNEKVFTLERNGTGFLLHAHHAGQALLRIIDSNDIIRYCAKVVVKDPIPLDYMEEYLVYDCEYWKSVMSWTDDYVITFNEGNQYTISGKLENVTFEPVTGTYEYVGLLNNGKEYEYKFTDTDIASLGLTGFHVATVGSFMYLQGNWGTEAILKPMNEMPE